MTDLDRKIAELKGWRPEKPFDQIRDFGEVYWLDQNGKRTEFAVVGFYHCDGAEGWDHGYHVPEFSPSCNTSQAVELVDEMVAMPKVIAIRIECYGSFETGISWGCGVTCDGGEMKNPIFLPIEPTIPEAICRAYIALKEWENR